MSAPTTYRAAEPATTTSPRPADVASAGPTGLPVLVGRGLHRSFGTTRALAGVDLAIAAGEAVAAMGPSGSGKSTLLHCLAGIEPPDGGEVWLGDRRIDHLGETARTAIRRRSFGFVFQSGHLLPELPAEENVALPLLLEGHPRRRAVAEARRWFGPLGLDGLEGRRPGELSGGQAQRVTIARALVTTPAVVFADEPTAALDRATGRDVVALLVEATRASGAGLLIVTHDPEVAAACHRRVVLRDGAVVDDRPPPPDLRPPSGDPGPTVAGAPSGSCATAPASRSGAGIGTGTGATTAIGTGAELGSSAGGWAGGWPS